MFRASHARAVLSTMLLLAAARPAAAAIFTVGSGAGCTHATIQAAVDAAAATPGADTIRLTRSQTYSGVAIAISTSDNLNIVGGFATCQQSAGDDTPTAVSGGFVNGGPVFTVSANGSAVVWFRLLRITGGEGRGIFYGGTGRLQLLQTSIDNNLGGGVAVFATGAGTELLIQQQTVISANGDANTTVGGGIELAGPVVMTMTEAQTIVAFNEALRGGGLHVRNGAVAYVGSPGFSGLAAIHGNYAAANGGGIDIADATVQLYTTQGVRPARVEQNVAEQDGGGIHVTGSGLLCAEEFVIDANQASRGSAIHADSGGVAGLNWSECGTPTGAERCTVGLACNSVSANRNRDGAGNPATGASIDLDFGHLFARRLRMRDNDGKHAIRADSGRVEISECLIAGNRMASDVVLTGGNPTLNRLTAFDCTIAGNLVQDGVVFATNGAVELFHSIVYQPGSPVLVFDETRPVRTQYLLVADADGLPDPSTIITGDPRFVDAANGDFHLTFGSPAVDFAPSLLVSDPFDLDRNPRPVDLPGRPNVHGAHDIGAYERQVQPGDCGAADSVFCSDFEAR